MRGYYSDQTEHIHNFLSQIPVEDYENVWGDGQGCSKLYCIVGITPCYKYFDNSYKQFPVWPEMQTETRNMLENESPEWIIVPGGENNINCLQDVLKDKYILIDNMDSDNVVIYLYKLKQ